jgi:peptidoglycan hydrolase-like protein with peptidoglycan-binding domain
MKKHNHKIIINIMIFLIMITQVFSIVIACDKNDDDCQKEIFNNEYGIDLGSSGDIDDIEYNEKEKIITLKKGANAKLNQVANKVKVILIEGGAEADATEFSGVIHSGSSSGGELRTKEGNLILAKNSLIIIENGMIKSIFPSAEFTGTLKGKKIESDSLSLTSNNDGTITISSFSPLKILEYTIEGNYKLTMNNHLTQIDSESKVSVNGINILGKSQIKLSKDYHSIKGDNIKIKIKNNNVKNLYKNLMADYTNIINRDLSFSGKVIFFKDGHQQINKGTKYWESEIFSNSNPLNLFSSKKNDKIGISATENIDLYPYSQYTKTGDNPSHCSQSDIMCIDLNYKNRHISFFQKSKSSIETHTVINLEGDTFNNINKPLIHDKSEIKIIYSNNDNEDSTSNPHNINHNIIINGKQRNYLQLNDKGDNVIALQKMLEEEGFLKKNQINGIYNEETYNSVIEFQKEKLFISNADGKYGKTTHQKYTQLSKFIPRNSNDAEIILSNNGLKIQTKDLSNFQDLKISETHYSDKNKKNVVTSIWFNGKIKTSKPIDKISYSGEQSIQRILNEDKIYEDITGRGKYFGSDYEFDENKQTNSNELKKLKALGFKNSDCITLVAQTLKNTEGINNKKLNQILSKTNAIAPKVYKELQKEGWQIIHFVPDINEINYPESLKTKNKASEWDLVQKRVKTAKNGGQLLSYGGNPPTIVKADKTIIGTTNSEYQKLLNAPIAFGTVRGGGNHALILTKGTIIEAHNTKLKDIYQKTPINNYRYGEFTFLVPPNYDKKTS